MSDFLVSYLARELIDSLILKASLLLAAAWISVWLCRRTSAAMRHAIWCTALCALILLPFLGLVLPAWHIARVEAPASRASSVDALVSAPTEPAASLPESGMNEATGASLAADEERSARGPAWPSTLPIAAWAIVALYLGLRLSLQGRRARALIERGRLSDDDEIREIADAAKRKLEVQVSVRLIESGEATMPFSFGHTRPTIVLPAGVMTWPRERKQSVLLHEMAHIARRDFLFHQLSEVARVLYWPNPLVWFAARRSAMERERACDDRALGAGTPSAVYATELMAIARAQGARPVPAGSITMAGKADLKERVSSVMNREHNREALPSGWLIVIGFLAFLALLPVAAVTVIGGNDESETISQFRIPDTRELLDELSVAEDPRLRRKAAWWLGEHESRLAVETLEEVGLADSDFTVRLASAWALGEIKDHGSIESLIELLGDEHPLVREMAVLALGEIEDPIAVDALIGAYEREPGQAHAVTWALGEIASRDALETRREIYADLGDRPEANGQMWSGNQRVGLASWLNTQVRAKMKGDTAVLPLIERLRQGGEKDRRQAAYAIGRLGIFRKDQVVLAIEPMLDAMTDPAPEVRAMAVWALDEINPSRHDAWRRQGDQRRKHY